MCLEQFKTWTEILANLATFSGIILGIIGAVYVMRQWRLTNSQWRFQKYDKLYSVYRANGEFINAVLGDRLVNFTTGSYSALRWLFRFERKTVDHTYFS